MAEKLTIENELSCYKNVTGSCVPVCPEKEFKRLCLLIIIHVMAGMVLQEDNFTFDHNAAYVFVSSPAVR